MYFRRDLGHLHVRHMSIRQPGFDLKRCLNNLHKLSDNFIAVFRKLYKGLSLDQALSRLSDFRCHMMVYHLIQWELFAIFAPEKIRLDLFDLLCIRGGGFLNCLFMTPELRIEPKPIIKTTQ